ncbi:MAG: VWA domain-containing protein, partial [Gammaproteobacteria bacterium]|nr:VWA domain-containing protein [Gammaproteobacteria bacterium]
MSDFVFAEPGWARLLWLVAGFAVLLFWLERRGATALGRFIAADLQPRLLRRPGRWRRALRLGALVLVGVACSIALMRPQWGLRAISSPVSSAEIMICLDVSRSMLADDVAPNRLQRAKAELRDLLGLLDGDRVGLIAFAGRASILSPLTPDFGFLRLALDGASANSVRRGGTRLEEPIRKAIEAFGASGDAARSILLITDGEDHDSIPLDAARAAAERGIRILAIGFGSETGSEIRVTDPDTGARVPLRDGRGAPVVSRLDGELLREMALITDGAYIPAGTGVLDLESIYRAHIAPLTRAAGERTTQTTRSARHEAFQVPLLLALLALLVALLSPLRARRETSRAQPRRRAAAAADNDSPGPQNRARSTTRLLTLALVAMLTVGLTAQRPGHAAQTSPAVAANGNPAERHDDATAAATSTPQASTRDVPTPGGADAAPDNADAPHDALPQDPREAYNLGQRLLAEGELSRAIQVLGEVRERSGTDEAVRFRATYNLGWAAARHAEMLVEQAPEQALEQLQSAQEWFRRAIELRPENEAARINLETVLDRLLALQDSLRKRDPQDLGQRLDELVEAQRGLLGSVREQTRGPDAAEGAQVSEQSRRAHRRLAADALQILSRADKVNEAASLELDALRRELNQAPAAGASEPPVDPGQQLRAAQLDAALHHLHTARERLAQARSQIRRNALQRGHRRAAAALDAFKRSRDQLHDPVTRLDRLIVDTRGQAALTAAAAGSLTPLA